jgi:hypothetical protein
MYALLDVADRVGWAKTAGQPFSEVLDTEEKPYAPERALSLYTFNRAYWESRFYDEAYWARYLEMLAQNRFNSLVVIFGYETNARYPDAPPIPPTVLINPTIEPLSDVLEDGWEGCLSVPGLRGVVPRILRLRYSGFDAQGNAFSREAEGFHARVVQHECDHLDGILYPMRIRNFALFGYNDVLLPGQHVADE